MRYIILFLLLPGTFIPAFADNTPIQQQQQMIQQQQQQFQQQRNRIDQQNITNTQTQILRDDQAQRIQQLNQRMQRNDPLWPGQQEQPAQPATQTP